MNLEPKFEKVQHTTAKPGRTIGLLANNYDSDETRLLLTPETCGRLIMNGWEINMETEAATTISYTDSDYAQYGVQITDRATALQADIVLSYAPIQDADAEKMKPGSALFCMFSHAFFSRSLINILKQQRITTLALDEVISHNGVQVFANIVDDVDGSAAIWYAQEALSFLGGGKGVLLGGIPGIMPCEILILGMGRKVIQAAKTALALGAQVTLMDNDMSELQVAEQLCGDRLVTCAIHPRPLASKVKTADVIFIDSCTHEFEFSNQYKAMVKKDAFILDFNLSSPSISTPRTVTQGLATCLYNLFSEIDLKQSLEATISTDSGVGHGVITYAGHLCNKLTGTVAGIHVVDLDILLANKN